MAAKHNMNTLVSVMRKFIQRFATSKEDAAKLINDTKRLGKAHHQAAEVAYKEIYD